MPDKLAVALMAKVAAAKPRRQTDSRSRKRDALRDVAKWRGSLAQAAKKDADKKNPAKRNAATQLT